MKEKFLRRADSKTIPESRYEKYHLKENPFPSSPFIIPSSSDARSNGEIYEWAIRQDEYEALRKYFLSVPQSDANHLRLGYIADTSYLGRGNGKSAFVVNLQKRINEDFSYMESGGENKCFALTIVPEPSGRTKTFGNFIDLFAQHIFESTIIEDSLAILYLEAILESDSGFDMESHFDNEVDFRQKLTSPEWFVQQEIDLHQVTSHVTSNPHFLNLPPDFPINSTGLFHNLILKEDFIEYYKNLKRGQPKLEFIFSHLVSLFLGAGFNGAYIFVDDFERIPDFQSERQKRDFALELRTCLFDGMYTNARLGFYVFFLVLHAGVPRLVKQAWDQSGLGLRAPISFDGEPRHIIQFKRITSEDAYSLIETYLQAYRTQPTNGNKYFPFTEGAVGKIADMSEFNASKILNKAYEVLERVADENVLEISEDYIIVAENASFPEERSKNVGLQDATPKNLMKEAE